MDPRQLSGEGGEEVEQGPGDDHVVVEAHIEGNEDHCKAHTCQTFREAVKGGANGVVRPHVRPLCSLWALSDNPPILLSLHGLLESLHKILDLEGIWTYTLCFELCDPVFQVQIRQH